MTGIKDQAIVWSDRLRLPRLFGASRDQHLTSILLHTFRFGDENWGSARERLRRQLDFLVSTYRPVDIHGAHRFMQTGAGQDGPTLLVTIDDAKREILEVFDIFEEFAVPVIQFVCAGWCEHSDQGGDGDGLKVRLVSWLHFYDGPARDVDLEGTRHRLDQNGNAVLIDAIIGSDKLAELAGIEQELGATARHGAICDWSELRDLQGRNMTIGCHSVSHPYIARQSATRRRFEIGAAKQLIENRLGPCPWFAYPYGTPDSHDQATHGLVGEYGFNAAFTTSPALSATGQDRLLMPRIVLPDTAMPDAVFKARVRGGGIPLTRLKERLS